MYDSNISAACLPARLVGCTLFAEHLNARMSLYAERTFLLPPQSLRLINPLISHAFLVFRLAFAPNARACLSASPNVSITGPLVRLTSSFARFTRTLVERDRFPSTVSLEQLLFVIRYTPHRKNESSLFLLSFSFTLSPFLFLFLSQVTCTCELYDPRFFFRRSLHASKILKVHRNRVSAYSFAATIL